MSEEWLTVEDIAKELRVPLDTVRFWIRSKKLKAFRPGKEYRVRRHDLDKFIQESSNMENSDHDKS
jgi:excisionase family DNA binding protein